MGYAQSAYERTKNQNPAPTAPQTVPTWEQFKPFVGPVVVEAWTAAYDRIVDASGHQPGDPPPAQEIFRLMIEEGHDIAAIIEERGIAYGEESIFLLGEEGVLMMVLAKMFRMLHGYRSGRPFEHREDSWVDLAGYAILALAMENYNRLRWEVDGG